MREFFKLDRCLKLQTKLIFSFSKGNLCWLSEYAFRTEKDRVKHYCKFSGKFLGAGHKSCIENVKKTIDISLYTYYITISLNMTILCSSNI